MEQLDASSDSADVAVATEAPESKPGYVDKSIDTSVADAPDDSDPPSETVEEDEEIEVDGKKFAIPKSAAEKLKAERMMHIDYTRKTQDVAEHRREVEARQAELVQREQVQRQNIAEYAEAYALDAQLKQYTEVNWQALIDSDPVQAMKLDRQMRELQTRRDQVVSSVTAKQQQQAFEQQQVTAKRLEEGRAVLEREIKGWSPETARQLASFGKEVGFSEQELAQVSDPRAVKLLHKAWQFDQLMKQQAAPQKEKPAPQEKPVTRITASNGTATKNPSQMTDREFAKWRSSQIKNRNR